MVNEFAKSMEFVGRVKTDARILLMTMMEKQDIFAIVAATPDGDEGGLWDNDLVAMDAEGLTFHGANGPSCGTASLEMKFDYDGNLISIIDIQLNHRYPKSTTVEAVREAFSKTRLWGFMDNTEDNRFEAIIEKY